MQAHPPGAVNVQIYRLIKEWTAWDIARRAAFAFFGIFAGTEENPEFIKSTLATSVLLFAASSPFIYVYWQSDGYAIFVQLLKKNLVKMQR
jgi:hypothetical protein